MKLNDFKILIAEDDPGIRRIYEKAFKQEGYDVVIASTGGEVLAELHEAAFDLFITDLKLDAMSALDTLPVVRKKYPKMPVIVVSGYYVNLVEEFHQKGFKVDMFLNKPLGMDTLKKAVRQLLGIEQALETA